MQATLDTLSSVKHRLTITVPLAEVNAALERSLKATAKKAKIQGFRPGKAPLHLVQQQFGYQIREETMDRLVDQSTRQAIVQNALRVVGNPQFEANQPAAPEGSQDFMFSVLVETFPEVKFKSFDGVGIDKPVIADGVDAVQKTLDVLRGQRARFNDVSRPAATTDRVIIDYKGTLDGEPFEGGQAENSVVMLGDSKLLPDFEAQLTGMSAGETKSFELTFPKDYAPEMAGKTVSFTVTVKQVAETILPEIDADFAKSLGISSGDVALMRAEIAKNVEREVARRLQILEKQSVMNALVGLADFEVPDCLVADQANRLFEEMKKSYGLRDLKADALPEALRQSFWTQAKNEVISGIAVASLINTEKLNATEAQKLALVTEVAQSYENPEEVIAWHLGNAEKMQAATAAAEELNVVAWVLAKANVTEVPVTFDELMAK